jgi:hypothetical protein
VKSTLGQTNTATTSLFKFVPAKLGDLPEIRCGVRKKTSLPQTFGTAPDR